MYLNPAFTFVLKLGQNLGIAENKFPKNIRIYPVPVSSNLNIVSNTSEIQRIRVYDLLGRMVLQSQPEKLNATLNMERLSPGMYILKLMIDGHVYSRKILKE